MSEIFFRPPRWDPRVVRAQIPEDFFAPPQDAFCRNRLPDAPGRKGPIDKVRACCLPLKMKGGWLGRAAAIASRVSEEFPTTIGQEVEHRGRSRCRSSRARSSVF